MSQGKMLKAGVLGCGFALLAAWVGQVSGCGSTAANPTTSVASSSSASEIAGESMTSAASSTEGGGTVAVNEPAVQPRSAVDALTAWMDRCSLISEAEASTCGSFLSQTHVCVTAPGVADTITLSGCNPILDPLVTWTGSESLLCSCPSSNCTITRTIADGTVRKGPLVTVTFHTTSATDYASVALANPGEAIVTCTSGSCESSRTLTLGGTELVGVFSGTTIYDFTVTATGVTVSGTGSSRQISAGTATIFHNLLKSTATSTISQTLSYTSGCCHPTAGEITTGYVGGTLDGKSETLTFTSTCGQATLVSTSGVSDTVTLAACL